MTMKKILCVYQDLCGYKDEKNKNKIMVSAFP